MIVALLLLQATAAPAGAAPQPDLSYRACLRGEAADFPDAAPEARWQAAWADALTACRGNRVAWLRYRLEALKLAHPDWTDARALNNIEFATLATEADAYGRFRHPVRMAPIISDRFIGN